MVDVADMTEGYAYYVYTLTGNPMDAWAVLRAKVREGYFVRVDRLVDGEWEYDPDGVGDITGLSGATGVRRVTEEKLRDIIKANTKTLDPDKVLVDIE